MSGQTAVTEGQCQVRQRSPWINVRSDSGHRGSMSGQIVVMGINVRSDSGHGDQLFALSSFAWLFVLLILIFDTRFLELLGR